MPARPGGRQVDDCQCSRGAATQFDNPDTPTPELQLLSNGRYHVAVTSAGGGASCWQHLALTRWRDDATCDNHGSFCYLRDIADEHFWSTTHQPTLARADVYQANFAIGSAEFRRRDGDVETKTTIVVAPDDDVELRRVVITNHAALARTIELTSYAEVVLAAQDADAAHPAFAKLFVATEWLAGANAILCTRRPRDTREATPWMFHLLSVDATQDGEGSSAGASFETDRLRFIGRGRSVVDPRAMHVDALSATAGPVLDPVVAIRTRIAIAPQASATVDLFTGIAPTREACIALVDKCRAQRHGDDTLAAAPARARLRLADMHATDADVELFRRMAGSVMYASASLRADAQTLARNNLGQSGLWGYSISGDFPVVLLRIAAVANSALLRQLVAAHAYWRTHGLQADLVVICAAADGGAPALAGQVAKAIADLGAADRIGQRGGVYVLHDDRLDAAGRILLQTVARVVIDDAAGTLAQQLERHAAVSAASLAAQPAAHAALPGDARSAAEADLPDNLRFGNGIGGFSADGQEYVIATGGGKTTPAPWVNVIANPTFGTLISDAGSANTWSENAQEFRLTPWSNDPVGDANTEAYYIRDERTGRFWSPTPLPCGGDTRYITRHGFGYSSFEHSEDGIDSTLQVFVAIDAPVKFATLELTNRSGRARELSVTGYLEWVLGDQSEKTRMYVITQCDPAGGALFARNPYNADFAACTAFFDADAAAGRSLSGDRTGFLGRNGTLRRPAAMSAPRLAGSFGAALDPCAAIRVPIALASGESREIVFRLGAGPTMDAARALASRFRAPAAAQHALAAVRHYWTHTLGAVQVKTADAALDVLVNGWLPYQILACRMWARNAFYQSSGAFGFRDQLQDAMGLVHVAPLVVREHLVRCASRQFGEGDVQHWWHPPSGRGVRTHCSDDYLWLPFATCRYVSSTGDTGVLDEQIPFLEGNAPKAGDSVYELPRESSDAASLYDHCVRAIDHGLRFGAHGLPLMGTGDWNDGMNLVGAGGKGESVWLGFFLCAVLTRFSALAQRRNDVALAQRYRGEVARLRESIESSWDGAWYRRAFFDDGSPLGAASNSECRIDSIAQSWSVLSAAGDAARARQAMDAVDRLLVQRDSALVQLLAPPFDKFQPDPGYIKGYLPGVRENGAQYTHAAVWAAMAFAALDDGKRAWELFTMLNPVNHASSPEAIATYMTEPYVVASDVYALAPHVGRGGWTWYTGSAGWMYRLVVESLLGLRIEADRLRLTPCMPPGWTAFELRYRYRSTTWHICVRPLAAEEKPSVSVDGVECGEPDIRLVDDQRDHAVTVCLQCAHH